MRVEDGWGVISLCLEKTWLEITIIDISLLNELEYHAKFQRMAIEISCWIQR